MLPLPCLVTRKWQVLSQCCHCHFSLSWHVEPWSWICLPVQSWIHRESPTWHPFRHFAWWSSASDLHFSCSKWFSPRISQGHCQPGQGQPWGQFVWQGHSTSLYGSLIYYNLKVTKKTTIELISRTPFNQCTFWHISEYKTNHPYSPFCNLWLRNQKVKFHRKTIEKHISVQP